LDNYFQLIDAFFMKKIYFLAALFNLISIKIGHAQDVHFSQMFQTNSLLNPALTGVFEQKATLRAAVQYRQQWASVAPAYRDFAASLERSGRVWQVGGQLYGHDAGAASLRTTGVRASAALRKNLRAEQSFLSLGASFGLEQQHFDPTALSFSNQYDADKGYVASQSNGEFFEKTAQIRPDFAVGLGWQSTFFSEKIKPSAGFSLAHLAQPMFSAFQKGRYGLPTAISFYGKIGVRASEKLVLTPFFWQMQQAGFKNTVGGLDLAVKMNAATVHLSGGQRLGDAILLKIGVDRGLNTFGVNYDLNTSKLSRVSAGKGGWEVVVAHFFNQKTPQKLDADRDGVPDKKDDCPLVSGKTACGCPPEDAPKIVDVVRDTDGDGVVDAKDECPDVAGLIKLSGCPDSDGDGVVDKNDQCPHLQGTVANNGCPSNKKDADDDGILDENDDCPYIKGLALFHGCPDTDSDGVPDLSDKCPFLRGAMAHEGCPTTDFGGSDNAAQRVREARNQATMPSILVEFDHDQSEIKPAFFTDLNNLTTWLYAHPTAHVMLAGHTDAEGNGAYNFQLGLRRAQAVEEYFVARRISPNQFELISYGETLPKNANESDFGKARNRRTEVIVLEQ
jgi:type IX secretion system PorP/SprF family membrane protein